MNPRTLKAAPLALAVAASFVGCSTTSSPPRSAVPPLRTPAPPVAQPQSASISPVATPDSDKWKLTMVARKGGQYGTTLVLEVPAKTFKKEFALDSAGRCELDVSELESLGTEFCMRTTVDGMVAEQWVSFVSVDGLPKHRFLVAGRVNVLPEWFKIGVNYPNIGADRMYIVYPQYLSGIGAVDVAPTSKITYSMFRDAVVYWQGSGIFTHRWSRQWVVVKERQ